MRASGGNKPASAANATTSRMKSSRQFGTRPGLMLLSWQQKSTATGCFVKRMKGLEPRPSAWQ